MTLPNFLIIGSGRSGTTSLHHYLGQHPDVFMSPKEPGFFAYMETGVTARGPGTEWLKRTAVTTLEAYEALFTGAAGRRAIGEASPVYLIDPAVPARVRALVPDVRLVAILRHPVDRAYAAWLGLRRDGLDPAATFEEALRDEPRRLAEGWPFAGLARNGFYHRLLAPWYALFSSAQVRVYLFDDLLADPVALIRDLFAFLGVEAGFVPDMTRRYGATGIVRSPILRAIWTRSGQARRVLRPVLPKRLRDLAFDWITRDLDRPPLAPATRARLLDEFRPDVLALQGRIGRDLSAWLR